MAKVNFGNTVKIHYAVKLDDGTVVDSTFDHEPFTFTLGMAQTIPGFELAVMGMSPETSKTVKVLTDDAYGPHYPELISVMDRKEFPDDFQFEVGQRLEMPQLGGIIVTVLDVSETTVTLDKNHPLAGKDLIIDIKLLEIL
jgi:peptidylprolyl isomerase